MPVSTEELVPFVSGTGPVHVVHEDGTAVTYGSSARLDMIDPNQKETWVVEEVELTIFDELSRTRRSIAGNLILEVERVDPGFRITVDASVEPDPGETGGG